MPGEADQPLDTQAAAELRAIDLAAMTVGTLHEIISMGVTSESLHAMVPAAYLQTSDAGEAFQIPITMDERDERYYRTWSFASLLRQVELAQLEGRSLDDVLEKIQIELSRIDSVEAVQIEHGGYDPSRRGLNNQGITLADLVLPESTGGQVQERGH